MKKYIAILGILIFIVILFIILFYSISESKSGNTLKARCEVYEISKLFNLYYQMKGEYPTEKDSVVYLYDNRDEIRCGRDLVFSPDRIAVDPWGSRYIVELTHSSVTISSTNNGSVGLKSVGGSIVFKPKELE